MKLRFDLTCIQFGDDKGQLRWQARKYEKSGGLLVTKVYNPDFRKSPILPTENGQEFECDEVVQVSEHKDARNNNITVYFRVKLVKMTSGPGKPKQNQMCLPPVDQNVELDLTFQPVRRKDPERQHQFQWRADVEDPTLNLTTCYVPDLQDAAGFGLDFPDGSEAPRRFKASPLAERGVFVDFATKHQTRYVSVRLIEEINDSDAAAVQAAADENNGFDGADAWSEAESIDQMDAGTENRPS